MDDTSLATLRARYDRVLRRDAGPDEPGARVERVGAVVRQTSGRGGWSGVVWSRFGSAAEADAAIAAQLDHFGACGLPFEWKLHEHDQPADLGARLTAAGFLAEESETVMVAEVAALDRKPVWPEGLTVREITDPAELAGVLDVHRRVFGGDQEPLRRRLTAQLTEAQDTVRLSLVCAGELPVCAARLELDPGSGFAGLWGGGTLPEWRGRGVYRALVAHRAARAERAGARWLHVDASAESRPILERLGFRPLAVTTPYLSPR
ncbi:Acetyltransferase (GNAT) domain-containing protein [Streptomyces zhaozhouensis]|uniref:Acetyltransferase (GNAT) domain-containing protein n=1 Tax=Streptomyces zhaozhouensis TaxID=1300267 RepID=A0A286DXC0_9ACTN|nr:GNAT family N-acetyltransferase [Streptomyces zhaozhouensis]SOD63315.1 Acetyltransferase (GNAT) domain-containing protein [Streptomyces zhaozhouensis]